MGKLDLRGHFETNETGGRRRLEDVAEAFRPAPESTQEPEPEPEVESEVEVEPEPEVESEVEVEPEVVGLVDPEPEVAEEPEAEGYTREALQAKTLPELRQIARDEGVSGVTTKSKGALVDAILDVIT